MDSAALLPCVEVDPPSPARRSIICLHGLGADGHDLAGLVPYVSWKEAEHTRWVFPHAPAIPVTINRGAKMPAWYDVQEIALQRGHDETGIRASATKIRALIAREIARGIPADHIHLMGFSQGGAMALYIGLRHPERLAGIIALSTYLVLADSLEKEAAPANRETPIFMAHGTHDMVVPIQSAAWSHQELVRQGYAVTWKTYPMGHEIDGDVMADLNAWLDGEPIEWPEGEDEE